MEIRVLTAEDAEIYREIRLRSLKENPEAFLTTYEREQNLPIEELRQKIKATEHQFTLGAFMDGELAGIVTFVRESRAKITHKGNVFAMYVSPEFRKQASPKPWFGG
nr:GNAT family N-acetyltransferase [Paenibacillus yonginensis]